MPRAFTSSVLRPAWVMQNFSDEHLPVGQPTLAQVAERTGYASPYAFAAAFRRHHGQPPGLWRQQQRERSVLTGDGAGTADDGVHFV